MWSVTVCRAKARIGAAGVTCPAGQIPGRAKYDIRGGTGDFKNATGSVEVTTCALVEILSVTVSGEVHHGRPGRRNDLLRRRLSNPPLV
jgi:hypothetical protein